MGENTNSYILEGQHIDAEGVVYARGDIIKLTDQQAKWLVNKVTLTADTTVDDEVTAKAETETADSKAKKPAKAKNDANDGF